MRDPDGDIRFESTQVVRTLHQPLDEAHFLRSQLARDWSQAGDLVAFDATGDQEVVSPRLPFISYPHEWCDAQLFSAAQLTLRLQKDATAFGFDLKDASAWNVLFAGSRPVFCDHLSFKPLRTKSWWALGQYSRHFVLPLLISQRRGLKAHQSFDVWRDGIPAETGRSILGASRYLSRYWPLVAGSEGSAGKAEPESPDTDLASMERFRASVYATLEWWLNGVNPQVGRSKAGTWGGYVNDRGHYASDSVARKRSQVAEWIERVNPEWVADLGCNTGEFSMIALEHGSRVVAIDGDHASIQQLFVTSSGRPDLYPLVASLDDMNGGAGWLGEESASLMHRLEQSFDLVMMLALVHHLSVAASIPLDAVAAFARRCTRKWLIVEFVDSEDSQMQLLCSQRQRAASDFSAQNQRAAFLRAGFEVHAELSLAPAPRSLALMKRSA